MPPIEDHLTPGPFQQQVHPAHAAVREAHGPHARKQPTPVQPVIRLLKIQKQNAPLLLLARRLEVFHFLQVQQHVVSYVAAWHKGCLSAIDDAVHGWPEPERQHLGYYLEVTVEQGDRSVAGRICPLLASPLVDEGDKA